jgi:hypothetical protein
MTGPIADFWSLFEARAAELAAAASADAPVYDELLRGLQDVNAGLYFEFSADSDEHELIITADGKAELFDLVRTVVAAAPPVQGWLFRALKPRLGFPKQVRWEGVVLDLATVTFDPLERAGSRDLGLRILIPGLDESQIDDAHNAILRAIDHGLGEERHAACIRHTELLALPEGADTSNFIPLAELEAFVEWRASQRGDG